MLCFATESETRQWLAALTTAAADAGLQVAASGTTTFDIGFAAVWIALETPPLTTGDVPRMLVE